MHLLYNQSMNYESYNDNRESISARIKKAARTVLSIMGDGFEQASFGEADLRRIATANSRDSYVDYEVGHTKIPDTLPDDWNE